MRRSLTYRPEIDGLRAIAVLGVVIYHLGKVAKGGFVGVDVFFVISGYLITSIIAGDMAAGRFSLIGFYERRIRRILPALFACLLATLVGAYVLLFPEEFATLAKGVLAATFFVANYFYAAIGGYFQPTAETLPLIHTWSLAVEEQFYVLFPLALLALNRAGRGPTIAVLALAATASFAWSEVLSLGHDDGAYYYLAPRGWELLVGSLLAIGAVPTVGDARLREAIAAIGLVALVVPIFAFNKNTPFPGHWALAPCLGAAAVIHCSAETRVGRLLSTRPFVGIGLISYSLYLWHLPIITAYKLHVERAPSYPVQLLLIAVSMFVAYLSFRYIEQPFRRKTVGTTRTRLVAYAAAAGTAIAALAMVVVLGGGLEDRFPPEVRRLAAFKYDARAAMRDGKCFISRAAAKRAEFDAASCLKLASDKPNVLILGDSHAAHLWAGFSRTFPGVNFLQATASGCSPEFVRGGSDRCRDVMDVVFGEFMPGKRLDAVILALNWKGNEAPALMRTVEALRAHANVIFVVGPVVRYASPLPRLLTRSALAHDPDLVERNQLKRSFTIDADFRTFFRDKNVQYISLTDALCQGSRCIATDQEGLPLQYDGAHLTAAGSALLARRLAGELTFGDCPTASLGEGGEGQSRIPPRSALRSTCAN